MRVATGLEFNECPEIEHKIVGDFSHKSKPMEPVFQGSGGEIFHPDQNNTGPINLRGGWLVVFVLIRYPQP